MARGGSGRPEGVRVLGKVVVAAVVVVVVVGGLTFYCVFFFICSCAVLVQGGDIFVMCLTRVYTDNALDRIRYDGRWQGSRIARNSILRMS